MTYKLKSFCILLILLTALNAAIYGQEKINVYAGASVPELINLGLRLQHKQVQLGLSYGSFPTTAEEKLSSISFDVFIHAAGTSKLSERKPLYVRTGINYYRDEDSYSIDKYLYFTARVGRDFNLTQKLGIQIDGGAIFELSHSQIQKVQSNSWFNLYLDFPVLPGGSIGIFYRL